MAAIHQLAVQAAQTTNLIVLCDLLTKAVNLAMEDGVIPHTHPVIRFISHMIAFAGDGDFQSPTYYNDVLNFCIENEDSTEIGEAPSEPSRKMS